MGHRVLKPSHEIFCQEMCKPEMTQPAAYMIAFPKSKLESKKIRDGRAIRLLDNVHIRARIEELRDMHALHSIMTLEQHRHDLFELREEARNGAPVMDDRGKIVGYRKALNVAVKAEELRGKSAGFYVDHLVIDDMEKKSPQELAEEIAPQRENPALHDIILYVTRGEDMPPERIIAICQKHLQDIPKVA